MKENMNLNNKKQRKSAADDVSVNEETRTSFTPGWKESVSHVTTSALPIKNADGKIIQVHRVKSIAKAAIPVDEESADDNIQDQDDAEEHDQLSESHHDNRSMKHPRLPSMSERIHHLVASSSIDAIKDIIATICLNITADPQHKLTIKHKKPNQENYHEEEYQYDMKDLLELVNQDVSSTISELAMLSARLVFQDIVPSYKIRQTTSDSTNDGEVRLKKETKRLLDYETSLLTFYRSYLNILAAKINKGLGTLSSKHDHKSYPAAAVELSFSAMKCQCELLRKIPYFNYHEELVTSIIHRSAAQHTSYPIRILCCQTLRYVFEHDNEGELSYDMIRVLSTTLTNVHYHVPEELIDTLQVVKVHVHIDKAKDIRKQVKKEKRKRKRHQDEADIAMMEGNAVKELSIIQKHQVNCLKEIAMIYFRIIKVKAGFNLFAVVLQGLGRITHLINIDMIDDLIPMLKDIISRNDPSPPLHVKILCIHCVLRTILGPGQELQVNDEFFLQQLHQTIMDLPADYHAWHLVYEAVDMAYLQRRETRQAMILAVIRSLSLSSCHLEAQVGSIGLALVHAILLRYPKIRIDAQILSNRTSHDCDPEERAEDYAMKALRDAASQQSNEMMHGGDGTLIATLMRHAMDKRYRRVVDAMMMAEIRPVPFQVGDARYRADHDAINIDDALNVLPDINQHKKKRSTSVVKFNAVQHHSMTMKQSEVLPVSTVVIVGDGLWRKYCKLRAKSITKKHN